MGKIYKDLRADQDNERKRAESHSMSPGRCYIQGTAR